MPRKYEPREGRLISEWLREFHPNALTWRRVRLGAIPGSPADKIYKGIRKWADLVFVEDGVTHLVEAKMRPYPGVVSQLRVYGMAFLKTPEFKSLMGKPFKLIFLTTKYDTEVAELCAAEGIEFIVFAPSWVADWWAEKVAKLTR